MGGPENYALADTHHKPPLPKCVMSVCANVQHTSASHANKCLEVSSQRGGKEFAGVGQSPSALRELFISLANHVPDRRVRLEFVCIHTQAVCVQARCARVDGAVKVHAQLF